MNSDQRKHLKTMNARFKPGHRLTREDCAFLKAALRPPADIVVYVEGGCVQGVRSTEPGISVEVWDADSPEDLHMKWHFPEDLTPDMAYRDIIEPNYPHISL